MDVALKPAFSPSPARESTQELLGTGILEVVDDTEITRQIEATANSLPKETGTIIDNFRRSLLSQKSAFIDSLIDQFGFQTGRNTTGALKKEYIILSDSSKNIVIYNKDNDIARQFKTQVSTILSRLRPYIPRSDTLDAIQIDLINNIFITYKSYNLSNEGINQAIHTTLEKHTPHLPYDINSYLLMSFINLRDSIMPSIAARELSVRKINAYLQRLRDISASLDDLARRAKQPATATRDVRYGGPTTTVKVVAEGTIATPAAKRTWANWFRGKPKPTVGGRRRTIKRRSSVRAKKSRSSRSRSRKPSSGGRAGTRRRR
jgi:hypothetical protein